VLAIFPHLHNNVATIGSYPRNCCVLISIIFHERLVGFCSMYGPKLTSTCIHLWEWMDTSLLDVNQKIGRHFNMFEWDGGVGYMISGLEKSVWYKCKSSLHLFDPNLGKNGVYYGGWFNLSKFR